MKTTTISVSEDVKQRFDAFFNRRRYEESQKGVKVYRASDAFKEIMDMAQIPEVPKAEEPKGESNESPSN
jgi:hypothetical protein